MFGHDRRPNGEETCASSIHSAYLEVPALKDAPQDEVGLGQALLHGEVDGLPDLVQRVNLLSNWRSWLWWV